MKAFFIKYKYQILIFFTFVMFRILMSPFFYPLTRITGQDEFGTIAGAAFFAGYSWSDLVSTFGFYGFGYSIFMAPLFKLTDNVVILYRCMQIYNGVCLGLSGVICYNLLKNYLAVDKTSVRIAITFASCAFFPNLFYSNVIYNENVLTLITWIALYMLLNIYRSMNQRKTLRLYMILLLALLIYSLTIHTRTLFLIGTTCVCLVYNIGVSRNIRIKPRNVIILLAASVVILTGVKELLTFIQENLWLNSGDGALDNTIGEALKIFTKISNIFSRKGFEGFLFIVIGETYGMIALTLGVGVIFLALLPSMLFGKCRYSYPNLGHIALFVIVFFAAVLALTGIKNVEDYNLTIGEASKWGLYVRYWSPVGGIIILLVFTYFYHYGPELRLISKVGLLITTITLAFFKLVVPNYTEMELRLDSSSIYTKYLGLLLADTGDILTVKNFIAMAVITTLGLAVCLLLIHYRRVTAGIVLSIAASLYLFMYSSFTVEIPNSKHMYSDAMKLSNMISQYHTTSEQSVFFAYEYADNPEEILIDAVQFIMSDWHIIPTLPPNNTETGTLLITNSTVDYSIYGYVKICDITDFHVSDFLTIWQFNPAL